MSGYRMFECVCHMSGIYETYWDDGWYCTNGVPPIIEENVLYRGHGGDVHFITLHLEKLIGLHISADVWKQSHTQLHDLIEIEGLTVYDAFKVLCL